MKIKLVDVEVNVYETTFGTCDWCMSVGDAHEPTYEFETEDGTKFYVKGYYWSWGDLETVYVDNVINFADYVNKQEFPENTEFDYEWLDRLVEDYDVSRGAYDY